MKRVFALLLVLLMAVSASAMKPHVVDNGALLSKTDVSALEEEFSQVYDDYGFTVAAVTVTSLEEKTAEKFAADLYRSSKYSNDGALLLICADEGEWYIYTSGLCAQVISDADAEAIGAAMLDDLQADNYAQAIRTFADSVIPGVKEKVEARNAAAQEQQKSGGLMVALGMLGGLAAGILVVALLAMRKPFFFKRNRTQYVPDVEEEDPQS